ncbi:MAG: Fic/DOC family protein [Coprobacillaceae bacterium]
MKDPYVYEGTNILKNLANIKDNHLLSQMEADYTGSRLSDLAVMKSESLFDYDYICSIHHYIFQDVYGWAGNIRTINIEKSEPALGGLSIEYSDKSVLKDDINIVLNEMKKNKWKNSSVEEVTHDFSIYLAKLWKIHMFREGNTRTIILFCTHFIEAQGWYVDSDLFRMHASYMRTALVAANATFHDIGDKRNMEYLEKIIFEALNNGLEMKERIIDKLNCIDTEVNEKIVREIVYWDRKEGKEHSCAEMKKYLMVKD